MADYCSGSYREIGPYSQTLFLGCSITNFNMSIGWGADASSITINLVEDNSYHPNSAKFGPLNTLAGSINALPSNSPSNALEINGTSVSDDTNKNLHRTVSRSIVQQNNNLDLGKIRWPSTANTAKMYSTDPDPGFFGLRYDIIGVPAYFKFDDGIFFGGIIKGWRATGSQGGSPTYEVELTSCANLLEGCQLIINNYIGSISTIINDNIAVPSLSNGDYTGSIKRGNIPNVFNIYGYLESFGFGTAGKTESGVSALQIYNALKDLTTGTQNKYSPYGAIVSKNPTRVDGNPVDTTTEFYKKDVDTIKLNECGLCRTKIAVDSIRRSLIKLDLGDPQTDGVPIPPNDLYINGDTMSILEFITQICSGSGKDFYVSFDLDKDNIYSGVIKIKTVSKRSQPSKDIIKSIVNNLLQQQVKISSFNYGQEFSNEKTRAMYIGGQQHRLLQVRSVHLAAKQTTLTFDPYAGNGAGSFVNYGTTYENHIRVPDEGNTRVNNIATDGGSAVGQLNDSPLFYSTETFGSSLDINRGNYYSTESINTQGNNSNPLLNDINSYALYLDLICPYFGNDGQDPNDSAANGPIQYNKVPRKVFWDKKMGQLQIAFKTNDITTLLSNPYTSNSQFIVLENELRAAGASFESWFSYCFDGFFSTDISDILYVHFKNTYPVFANKGNFLAGLSILNWNIVGKSAANQSMPPSPYAIKIEHAQPYVRFLFTDLQKIHSFFKNIYDTYYGKSYMVRTPKINSYTESDVQIGLGNYVYPGAGKVFTNWEISTQGAWEEEGNHIDDTMIVGSTTSEIFRNDDGRIGPILGFNASAELATKDYWGQMTLAARANSHSLTDLVMSQTRLASAVLNQTDYFYFPLEHDISSEKYTYIPYKSPAAIRGGLGNTNYRLLNLQTSHGVSIPNNWIYKMYVSCDIDDKIIFLDGQPRAIVTLPNPIYIGGGKNDTESSLPFNMIHDAVCIKSRGATIPANCPSRGPVIKQSMTIPNLLFAWGLAGGLKLVSENATVSVNNSSPNTLIAPKATCPAFAAIPVKFNQATYGPWINLPGLIGNTIFPNITNTDELVNNLCGGVKVEVQEELVPWNYGGMDALDAAVMSRIKDDISYQQVHEQGMIQVAGIVLTDDNNTSYGIGDILGDGGPLINNMSMSIGEGGITTTYNMRTYTRKLGFFNKENADRIRDVSQEFAKRKREIKQAANRNYNITRIINPRDQASLGDVPKPLRTSPLETMVGAAYPFINYNSAISNITTDFAFSPSSFSMPYTPTNIAYNPTDMVRYMANVAVQDIREVPRELKDDYAQKSIMSLDGLFSPISFYPTQYGSTYNVTKYPRSGCPFCKGTASYSYSRFNLANPPTQTAFADFINSVTQVTIPCTFCEPEIEKVKRQYTSASPRETTPPYVIASGDDLTIISRNNFGATNGISGNPTINYMTLNPVILSIGEFSCFQNRREDDRTAHCIDVVGVGLTVPEQNNSLKLAYSSTPTKNYLDYDQNYLDWCANNSKPTMGITPANNMRFFGLRGPLMVHGWGYDTEGYPVPNSSGEPKLLNGQIVRDSDGNIVYKNQVLDPITNKYTKPYKENTFYKGWGQFPGTWPVGPVDLRWDSDAKVWTVGANYKPVWVLLETDLLGDTPTRGEILDGPNDNSPLPSGLRKLVFVKDSLGMNPAPRGAPVYCKYDSKNGFYEPIYNRPFVTSGIIAGPTSVNVYNIYKNTNSTYNTVYKNPLGFNVSNGDAGIFAFIGSGWVLQSYKC
jgi:hypothetical protein